MSKPDDPAEERRGLPASAVLLALLPSPVSAGCAAILLMRPSRLVFREHRAFVHLAQMAAVAVATAAAMFTSSVTWFGLAKALGVGSNRIAWAPHLRHLAHEALSFASELFVALLVAEAIRKILARRADGDSALARFFSENAFKIGVFLSYFSTKTTLYVLYDVITDGFYNIFKIIMIILLSSIYDFASIVLRTIRFLETLWTFPSYALEIAADFLTASLPDAFLWIPILTIWSAFLIAADVARRFASLITKPLIA